ncbi:MAG: tetratricopeptide repeat protein [Ignavibacteriae bacterium]|nr:tetratricopeptide repeat protein [Ignavibacteriota bacterium]
MKRYSPIMLVMMALFYLSTTGYQCGSAEMTTARLAMQQQQWDKAEQSLMKEVLKNDKNEEAWFLLGQVHYELKKYVEMNEAYARALALSDAHKADIARYRMSAWAEFFNKGVNYYNRGKDTASYYDKAIESFSFAIQVLPDSASTYYVNARAHYAKNENQEAIRSLEECLAKDPNRMDAAGLLGQIHMSIAQQKKEQKDDAGAASVYVAATAAFEKAYSLAKDDPDTSQQKIESILRLIEVYEASGQAEKALAFTRDAVASDPDNKIYRYAYGVFLLKQNRFEESIEQFKKVLEIDPDDEDATYNRGVAYLNWGVALKAELDKKAELDGSGKGKSTKATKEELAYKEKLKEALPYLEKSAERRKEDAQLWTQLGRLYTILNMVDKSKMAFDAADKLMKNN